ncbi:MAG: iron-sulfur cluster repair di-iron protein [Ignavibacteriaceae bacterium]
MESLDVRLVNEKITHLSLSEIVTNNFKSAAIFEKYGLDFCCHGKKLISEACEEKGVSVEEVLTQLENLNENNAEQYQGQYNQWNLDFLADYIVTIHHKYVRNMIPVISAHADKVTAKHGHNHPELISVANNFTVVYKDLKQHMMKEEQLLFPYIKYLINVQNNSAVPEAPFFGTIKNPVQMMEAEHESAGNLLAEIESLTNNYTPPADACNTFKVFYQELREFEQDLHKHVHLENNILFPRSIELENKLFNQ